MILSHKHKFIYFCNAKTGSESMFNTLKPEHGCSIDLPHTSETPFWEGKHITPVYAKENLLPEDVWNSYFKFSFVRNSWDWVISNMYWNDHVYKSTDLFNQELDKLTTDDVIRVYDDGKQNRCGIDWHESYFQTGFLSDRNGDLLVDYIGDYDNLQKEFDEICKKVGVPQLELPFLHKSENRRDYKDYYNEETIELVRKLYAIDIDKFGFRFS